MVAAFARCARRAETHTMRPNDEASAANGAAPQESRGEGLKTAAAATPAHVPRGSAAALVGVLATAYMISQFFRNSIGVIGPDLAREFDLDAHALSLLASIFFFSFALAQIPLGMAIDRFGPRAALLGTASIAILGAFGFVFARDYHELLAARLVLGLGCSSFLMAPLTLYADRFPPRQFASVIGFHVGGGNVGSLIATAPLALAAAAVGWRGAFFAIGVAACAATLVVWLTVRESEGSRARRAVRRETVRDLLAGVRAASRAPGFWPIFLMHMATYPSFAAILGLWSGPWLAHVYGMDVSARGWAIFAMVVAQIIGLFAWGATDRFFKGYKAPVYLGAGLGATLLMGAALLPPSPALAPVYLMALGFVFGFTPLLTAHGKSLFPERLMGRGLSLMNVASIGGVFFQQTATGLVIGLFAYALVDSARVYPPEAYRAVFAILALEIGLALLLYRRAPDFLTKKTA